MKDTGSALLLVSSLSAALLCGCGETQNSGSFESITYNVAGLPEGLSSSNPARNIPQIGPKLNDWNLVLVQEDFAYHFQLSRGIELPFRSAPSESAVLVNDGLNRFSDHVFEDSGLTRVAWNGCFGSADSSDGGAADCLAKKGFSVATTEIAPGLEVDVYNVHFEAGGTAEDERLRDEGVDQLNAFIATHSAGRSVIVAGDTNLHAADAVDEAAFQRLLSESGLTDACRAVDCGHEHIDRFLFRSGPELDLSATNWRNVSDHFVDDEGEALSDHAPISVTFEWTQKGL